MELTGLEIAVLRGLAEKAEQQGDFQTASWCLQILIDDIFRDEDVYRKTVELMAARGKTDGR